MRHLMRWSRLRRLCNASPKRKMFHLQTSSELSVGMPGKAVAEESAGLSRVIVSRQQIGESQREEGTNLARGRRSIISTPATWPTTKRKTWATERRRRDRDPKQR